MKKYLSTIILSLCFGVATVQAADVREVAATADSTATREDRFRMLEKPFMMVFSAGANLNTGGRHNSEVFGYRPDAATQINFRFNIGFHRNWNVYADLGCTFYSIQADPYFDQLGDLLMNLFMPGVNKIHPSFSIGASYLSQVGRWQFMPRIGAGCQAVRTNNQSKERNGIKTTVKREIAPYFIEGGFGVGFRTSRVCSLIFDICYHHPLESASLTVSTSGSNQDSTEKFKSNSWANDLSLSLGFQLQTDLSRSKRAKAAAAVK